MMITKELNSAIKRLKIENVENNQITKIGEGAWHVAYRIERKFEDDFVLRIKKKKAYGQLQEYNELDLITEYESSKAYYQQANKCSFNVCPLFFDYFLDETIVFTVESFMGEGVKLQSLNNSEAFTIGEKLGKFLQVMHKKAPDIKGFGNLIWKGKQLEGSLHQDANQLWQRDNDYYISVLNKLNTTNLKFDRDKIGNKILTTIEMRRLNQQNISLVNQDVTPENIIFDLNNVSLIDPFPRLDFDLKFAGYFVFCYKFLLPAYSNVPRYRNNNYNQNRHILSIISDGFIKGYIGDYEGLYKHLMDEYILWTLLETYEHYEILNKGELSHKTMQQMGDKEIINKRLILCIKELENLCL